MAAPVVSCVNLPLLVLLHDNKKTGAPPCRNRLSKRSHRNHLPGESSSDSLALPAPPPSRPELLASSRYFKVSTPKSTRRRPQDRIAGQTIARSCGAMRRRQVCRTRPRIYSTHQTAMKVSTQTRLPTIQKDCHITTMAPWS